MARKRRKRIVALAQFLEVFEQAYQEWKKWADFHSHLCGKGYAMEGTGRGAGPQEKEVKKAFGQFDNAIRLMVAHDKTALGDPRVLERINQAQWLGDKYFFEELAGAIKKNVGVDRRLATDAAVALLYHCAVRYLHGDKKCIRDEYLRWERMSVQQRRLEKPNDARFQSLLDHWGKAKESITKGGLKNFRERVKRMAEQLRTGSMPIPTPIG